MKATAFCTKCNTNWSRLPNINNEALDESYDFCPVCKTDEYLTDGREGQAFFYDLQRGPVNTVTGEVKEKFVTVLPPSPKMSKQDIENNAAVYGSKYLLDAV